MSTITPSEHLNGVLDERTLAILERRRASPLSRRRGWLVRRALLMADVVGLSISFLLAQEVFATRAGGGTLSQWTEFVTFALSLPMWIVVARLYGLYDKDEERADHSTADDFVRLFHLITVCTFFLYASSRFSQWFDPTFEKLFLFWFLAIVTIAALRGGARIYCRRQIQYLQNTIIVGAGDVGQTIALKLLNHPEYGINLVGFVDAEPRERSSELAHLTVLGDPQELPGLVQLLDVERVIFAFSGEADHTQLSLIRRLREHDLQIDIVPRLFDSLGPSIAIHDVEGVQLIGLPSARLSASSLLIKRLVDVAASLVGITILLPLLGLVAVAIKCDSRGPIFYRHERAGRGGKKVELLKFRTMRRDYCRGEAYGGDHAEAEFARLMSDPLRRQEFETAFKLTNDPRVTRVGRFLRKASIDELPQLLNVLRGDLSLVGPRALTDAEISSYYGPDRRLLLGIRPGITGYWQINGRSQLAYADRVRLDLAYIGGWSLNLDLLILFKTLRVLVSRRGAY